MTSIFNHLEQYLESIKELPDELRSHMSQIRVADGKAEALFDQLQQEQREFVVEAKQRTEAGEEIDEEQLQVLKEKYRSVLSLCDRKVTLASGAYELLDEAINKLDTDLRKFEAELEQKELNLTAAERRKRKASSGLSLADQRRLFAGGGGDIYSRSDRRRVQGLGGVARTFDVAMDMPVDPNEPTYCICNRVSFGEMVGCDNPECRREWFHFECVGLSANPKGKWLCPECSSLKRKSQLPAAGGV